MNIIELAKEAGFETKSFNSIDPDEVVAGINHYVITDALERFAALVRAEREWVDLTDDEIEEIGKSYFDEWSFGFARAVIAAFKEKNK